MGSGDEVVHRQECSKYGYIARLHAALRPEVRDTDNHHHQDDIIDREEPVAARAGEERDSAIERQQSQDYQPGRPAGTQDRLACKVQEAQRRKAEQTSDEPEREDKVEVGDQHDAGDHQQNVLEIEYADGRARDLVATEVVPTPEQCAGSTAEHHCK